MEWKKFKESSIELPEVTVINAVADFSKATDNLARIIVAPLSDTARLSNGIKTKFQFQVILVSDKLENFTFRIFSLGYGIELFPVRMKIEPSILVEMNKSGAGYVTIIELETEEEFRTMLKEIFDTSRFESIVSGLMKIARKESLDLPF